MDWVTSTLIVPLNGFALTTPISPISFPRAWISSGQAPAPGHTPVRSGVHGLMTPGRHPCRLWLPREHSGSPPLGEDRGVLRGRPSRRFPAGRVGQVTAGVGETPGRGWG